MKFSLQLSRVVTEERDKKKFEELGFGFQLFDKSHWPYNTELKKSRYISINSPEVEFETLEDLKKFTEKVGEVIVRSDNVIEIL
jgi:hypothetical protein